MIKRYSRPEMVAIWSEETKYQIWLDVELAALQAMEEEGVAPQGAASQIRGKAKIDIERIVEIEAEVKHDVIAFLTAIAEQAGQPARFLHRGMTSSDLLDTSFAIQLTRASTLLDKGLEKLLSVLHRRAIEYKYLPTIGRSHGIHAEPTTFGLKLASFYAELLRRRHHFNQATQEVATGKIAGAVGTYQSVSPSVEAKVLRQFGLTPELVPSQIVHRDRHAAYFTSLALIASSLERMVTEIRHLQRTEVAEVEEGFGKAQKGSSAMPHKKNPILSENVSGLARLIRGYAVSALENVALWHERDISHSSVERIIAPDACVLLDFALARVAYLIETLVVHDDKMRSNIDLTGGLIFSGSLLISLADKGMSREDAYALVQKYALTARDAGSVQDAGNVASFQELIEKDATISSLLTPEELRKVFSLERHFLHVEEIFARTFEPQ
jgi:adenylosuccinate lyase